MNDGMDEESRLQTQISDMILNVANSYPKATTSDLLGMADVAARKILDAVKKADDLPYSTRNQ